MDWVAFASAALAVLALIISYLEYRRARAAEKDADARADRTEIIARDALKASQDAATAAQAAAEAQERVAVVMEQQAVEAARAAPVPEPAWRLEHFDADTFMLTNVGAGTAFDVRFDSGDLGAIGHMGQPLNRDILEPGESIRFLAARMMGTRNDTVTVTWGGEPGAEDQRTWSRPLPPKSRNR